MTAADEAAPGGRTILVLGDQLTRDVGPLAQASVDRDTVLFVESGAALTAKRWHRQRAHLVVAGMRRLAGELRANGFDVDYRRSASLAAGLDEHRAAHPESTVVAMEPSSWSGRQRLREWGVELEPSELFLCSHDEFAEWAADRKNLRMEDFYRWQRRRLGYLMDGDEPAGGRWNFDHDNREPPPRDPVQWPEPVRSELDELDAEVLADLPSNCWGEPPDGTWATSRAEALRRLDHAVDEVLPRFGPHEDAMLSTNWHLAHTLLSPYLNVGLLLPAEVCDRVEIAYRSGAVPIASAEGFIRQVIGWREYVWGVYWQWMPDYLHANELDATRPLPPVFTTGETEMRCVSAVLADVDSYGWTHHIQRLIILGNLALVAGVEPRQLVEWMWASFVDGAEWVMVPNVVGMALHADGGRMASKPYAGSGAYIDRMSDYCGDCRFDRRRRTGDDACPFTTLYWDFIARHAERFERNPRMARQVSAFQRLSDRDAIGARAVEVLGRLDRGEL